MELICAFLGLSWAPAGQSLRPLGALLGRFGALLGNRGLSCAVLGPSRPSEVALGAVLGPSGDRKGASKQASRTPSGAWTGQEQHATSAIHATKVIQSQAVRMRRRSVCFQTGLD